MATVVKLVVTCCVHRLLVGVKSILCDSITRDMHGLFGASLSERAEL